MIYQKQTVNYLIIQVYVGGSPSDLSHRSVRKGMFGFHKNELPRNFLGCLKKVTHCFVSFSLSRLLTIFVWYKRDGHWPFFVWSKFWLQYPQSKGCHFSFLQFVSWDERWQMITKQPWYYQLLITSLWLVIMQMLGCGANVCIIARAMCVRKCVRKFLELCVRCACVQLVFGMRCAIPLLHTFWTKWQDFLYWNIRFSLI